MSFFVTDTFTSFFRGLSSENPDLVQLKSLLAGLTLPVRTGSSEITSEDRDGTLPVLLMPQSYRCSSVILFNKIKAGPNLITINRYDITSEYNFIIQL